MWGNRTCTAISQAMATRSRWKCCTLRSIANDVRAGCSGSSHAWKTLVSRCTSVVMFWRIWGAGWCQNNGLATARDEANPRKLSMSNATWGSTACVPSLCRQTCIGRGLTLSFRVIIPQNMACYCEGEGTWSRVSWSADIISGSPSIVGKVALLKMSLKLLWSSRTRFMCSQSWRSISLAHSNFGGEVSS